MFKCPIKAYKIVLLFCVSLCNIQEHYMDAQIPTKHTRMCDYCLNAKICKYVLTFNSKKTKRIV